MSQARHQTTVHDLEDAPLAFDSSIRSLIENAAHLAVTLWRVPAAGHARALFLSPACPYPRGESAGVNRRRHSPKGKRQMRRSEEHTSELHSHLNLVCR